MMAAKQPKYSVIVSCGRSPKLFSAFMNSFIRFHDACDIELMLITPAGYEHKGDFAKEFFSFKELVIDDINSCDQLRCKCVLESHTEYIFFFEDHIEFNTNVLDVVSEKLVNYDCVSWIVKHANPTTFISRLTYYIEYSDWGTGNASREIKEFLTGHNNAYKRSALIKCGENLLHYLRSEITLHRHLVKEGRKLYYTDEVCISHHQFEKLMPVLLSSFWFNWNDADGKQKIEKWKKGKRLFYAFAILVKPFLRLFFYLKKPTVGIRKRLTYMPIVLLIFAISAFGESCAYLLGTGKSPYFYNH